MFPRQFVQSTALVILLLLSSCNLVRVAPGVGDTGDPQADQQTQVALAVQQTQAAAVPDVPQFTFTPSETPSITLSPTPDTPRVTVSVETNCRTGPGEPYQILGVLPVGVSAEVIGRTAYGDTWIIKLPSNPSITCWLWGYYATVVGNTAGLTVYTPPPTPTPSAGFSLSYLNTLNCEGVWAFRLQIVNTGSVTWKSHRVVIYDATTSLTTTNMDNYFHGVIDCVTVPIELQDLEPGEGSVTGNWNAGILVYNPAGHSITATLTLCSLDGMGGQCVDKSISFTP